ncbi:acyl-CoA dehydrogenase [Ectothiorhodospiraceae bacterium WFHF3C12]|nr:acyl-CoA dehydrogenase [Ectothiorhodospiraceae bacterium WFHF3C12]
MTDQCISRRDLIFNLFELHRLDEILELPRFAEHDPDTCEALLDAAIQLAEEEYLPHAAELDADEPEFDGKEVRIIPQVKKAVDAFLEGGFLRAQFDEDVGGLQLPTLFAQAMSSLFPAANVSTSNYTFLTTAAANLLKAHASDDQQQRYMAPMLDGRFFGTMCLSEPHAGSSLADIKTRAKPLDDGRYRITGNKMWISGGDHELSENIVHMVLAKIDGAPAGVKGISLFIVPKKRVDADGTVGERNGVELVGLNHKMGHRGTTNCALAFGDNGECIGELVGEPHKGLQYMFHMMNEARIGVGMAAVGLGYAGYLYSLDYARQRPQGRPLTNKDPSSAPVPIIEHPDVRRMLLAQKSYVEGGLALGLYCARLVDEQNAGESEATRREATKLLDLLTPIVKSWPSEFCLEANKLAIQCLGGYGYTREYPVERLYRDNRLNHIHEGTYGIQGLDLLGRKVIGDGGRTLAMLAERIHDTTRAVPDNLREYADAVDAALQRAVDVSKTLGRIAEDGRPNVALSNATVFLDMLGHTVVAWLWLKQAVIATETLASDTGEAAFYQGKLNACRYFFGYELPKTGPMAELLEKADPVLTEIDTETF